MDRVRSNIMFKDGRPPLAGGILPIPLPLQGLEGEGDFKILIPATGGF